MHNYPEDDKFARSDSGVSAITGTLLMVALTIVLASVIFYIVASLETPGNLTKTSMKIFAFNSSTLSVTSMVGDSIPIESVKIVIGPNAYNASGIVDSNTNNMWDPGETIFLYGLDLSRPTSVVITTGTTVILAGTVQWNYSPVPAGNNSTPGGDGTFTSYRPGLKMTTFSGPSFATQVNARVAPGINYACPDAYAIGFPTNDMAWPQSEAGAAHNFSVKFEGSLYIDENATYMLQITASDGVYVVIDDISQIINVTGDHLPQVHMADLYLTSGYHRIEVGYSNYNSTAVIGDFAVSRQPGGPFVRPGLFYLESTSA